MKKRVQNSGGASADAARSGKMRTFYEHMLKKTHYFFSYS